VHHPAGQDRAPQKNERRPVKTKTPAAPAKRILVVDDHAMIREGLSATIRSEPGLEVCGAFGSAYEALAGMKTLQPDLVLLDITLPDKNGLELLKDIRVAYPHLSILVLSMHDDSLYAERALRAGAGGYITKQQPPRILLAAIHSVLGGRIYLSEQASESILRRLSGHKGEASSAMEGLTDREFEIFQLIGEGLTTAQIARKLHLSPKTIAVHYSNIRGKLKLPAYTDLIRYAVRRQEGGNLTKSESLQEADLKQAVPSPLRSGKSAI
jgi:DNA-binding NarL/FixJ family response regulator